MKFIRVNEENRVVFIHHFPEQLKENEKQSGLLIDDIPEAQQQEGKDAILYYEESKGFWYEYIDKPKTEIEMLEEKINLMQQALDELLLGGII